MEENERKTKEILCGVNVKGILDTLEMVVTIGYLLCNT